jgi:hypothetical protein
MVWKTCMVPRLLNHHHTLSLLLQVELAEVQSVIDFGQFRVHDMVFRMPGDVPFLQKKSGL